MSSLQVKLAEYRAKKKDSTKKIDRNNLCINEHTVTTLLKVKALKTRFISEIYGKTN